MICKSCGHLLSDNDKFCPECGTRVVVDASQVASERPVTQGGRDAMGRTDGTPAPSASQGKERNKRHFQFEEIDWNLDGYPTEQKKATDDVDFNWESVIDQHGRTPRKEEPEQVAAREKIRPERPEKPQAPEVAEVQHEPPVDEQEQTAQSIEEVIFGTRDRDGNISETQRFDNPQNLGSTTRMDKFYTYNKKNEEFQALLDKEYNRLKDQLDVDYREPEEPEGTATGIAQNPVFEAPSFGAPGAVTEEPTRVFDAAVFEAAPAFEAPAFGVAPAFGAAEEEASVPAFEMPTFDDAVEEAAPEEHIAQAEAEEAPEAGAPAFDLPEEPTFEAPQAEEPAFEAPQTEEPSFEMPQAEEPAFVMPEMPTFEPIVPEAEDVAPQAPAFEIPMTEEPAEEPAFVMPELPTFDQVAPVEEVAAEAEAAPEIPTFEPEAPVMPEMPAFEATTPEVPRTEESMVEIPSFMRTETPAFEEPQVSEEPAAEFAFPTFEPEAPVEEPAVPVEEPVAPVEPQQPEPEVIGFEAPHTPEGYFVETPQPEIPREPVVAAEPQQPAMEAAPADSFAMPEAPAQNEAEAPVFEAPTSPFTTANSPFEAAADPFAAPQQPSQTEAATSVFEAPVFEAPAFEAPAQAQTAPEGSPFGAPADPFAAVPQEDFVHQEAPQTVPVPEMDPFVPTKSEDNAAEIEKMIREDTAGGIPNDDNKITFQDVFKDELEAEAKAKARKPKKYLGLKIFAIILCVLIVLEIVVICIKYLAPESAASVQLQNMFNGVYNGLSSIFGG